MNQKNIRNFSIIAHIDHGKTTLTDRLLQLTNTVTKREFNERLLDSNPIEKERGITIKLAPVTLNVIQESTKYQLNLIDTPGHVDFSYEVERSLAACETAILLIDASQGVQAQTMAHAHKAANLGLHIIPVLNKIDLISANISQSTTELNEIFGFKKADISHISAKNGKGVNQLLNRIISEASPPQGESDKPLRALVFNSTYDSHMGVIAFVRIVDGQLNKDQELYLIRAKNRLELKELGIFTPERNPQTTLTTGQVGYIATGLKNVADIKVGDTITIFTKSPTKITSLPGYKEPKHTVFADFYPSDTSNFSELKTALEKLALTDASLTLKHVNSQTLGSGFRLGFLGLFHIEITKERLLKEQFVSTIITNPTVEYQITLSSRQQIIIHNPNDLPDPASITEIKEPTTSISILTPKEFVGPIMDLVQKKRGKYQNTLYLSDRAQLIYHLPLAELISGFFDELKSISQGFATLDYELIGFENVAAVKLIILLNHQEIKPLARIVVKQKAEIIGQKLVSEIKNLLPRHLFAVPIQAAIGGKIIARETKPAARKDVTAKLYGGDQTRKDKLLKKQKKGKKLLAKFGKVSVPGNILTKLATI